MAIVSKQQFYETIGSDITCHQLLHPWTRSCLKANIRFVVNVCVGVSKFYIPIYLVKALWEKKKINRKYATYLIKSFLRSVLYGLIYGIVILECNCLLFNLFGRFNYYNIGIIPGMASGLSILIESVENKNLNLLFLFTTVVEALLRNLDYFKIIKFTKSRQTVCFMIASALLMYLFKRSTNKIYPHIWYYVPPKASQQLQCNHGTNNKQNCLNYCLDGSLKYFAIGYVINIVKALMPILGSGASKSRLLYKVPINKGNFRFGLFLGSYVGLFRMLSCLLFKYDKKEAVHHPLIAGLLCGATYAIKPNINVLTIALTTLLQFFYNDLQRRQQLINHLPLREMLFMLCNGLLLHNRIMYLETCPRYYTNVTNIGTNNFMLNIYSNFMRCLPNEKK